jgi:hypothetical protein
MPSNLHAIATHVTLSQIKHKARKRMNQAHQGVDQSTEQQNGIDQ